MLNSKLKISEGGSANMYWACIICSENGGEVIGNYIPRTPICQHCLSDLKEYVMTKRAESIKNIKPMTDSLDKIAKQVDQLENVVAMIQNRHLPDKIHLDSLRSILPKITSIIKQAVIDETGENPWT